MLCKYFLHCNSIRYNRELVFIINSYDKGLAVYDKDSFRRLNPLFVGRALIQPNGKNIWIIDSDVYLVPNKQQN